MSWDTGANGRAEMSREGKMGEGRVGLSRESFGRSQEPRGVAVNAQWGRGVPGRAGTSWAELGWARWRGAPGILAIAPPTKVAMLEVAAVAVVMGVAAAMASNGTGWMSWIG
jgi:hypothetical protein